VRDAVIVMPTKVGIHDFSDAGKRSRGWWAFAHHDDVLPPSSHSYRPLVLERFQVDWIF
jgi:hypothetical protein